MVEYFSKRSKGEDFARHTRALSSDVWVNAPQVTENELRELTERFQLDKNIVLDVRDREELPRIEFSGEDAYVFFRVPRVAKSGRVATEPMLAVVKKDSFLTIGTGETIDPEMVAEVTQPATIRHTIDLLVGVAAAAVATYQSMLSHTERSITDTASRLRTHEVTNQDFIHFVTVEDNLMSYRLNLTSMRAVMRRIGETTHESMSSRDQESLDDIELEIEQLLVAVESYTGQVESIRNAYSTIADNTLNLRIKTLTVFTVLITLPNVVFGMYGMNIALPAASQPWAYLAVVCVTALLVLGVYIVGRKTKIF